MFERMADDQELAQLELLCKQLYVPENTEERSKAESSLVAFSNSPDCLAKCQLLLERSGSSYAQLLASTSLTKLVSKTPCTLSIQQRLDIRNYVLNYLATRPKLVPFVVQSLVQLYARITKLGWFESDKNEFAFRRVIQQVRPFLQESNSVEYCVIGVQLLSQLTCEINLNSGNEAIGTVAKQRKIASSFRDSVLLEIFQISHDYLRKALVSWKDTTFQDKDQQTLINHLLRLSLSCLSFDFIGTQHDDTSDDLATVQIPTNWKPALLDFNTLQLFFDLYRSLPSSLAPLALSCLVQIASVRRSVFSNAERAKFLMQLLTGVRYILENPRSLTDPNCYHEFCRLLARLKSNYQLSELIKVDGYPELIALITKFTVSSLQMCQFPHNSVHYLLTLWQRMVASVPYVKAPEPHLLETYTPEITRAYITSRLESVTNVVREGMEDPFDDIGMVQQQLDQLSTIARCEYEQTCSLIVQLFDSAATAYQDLLNSGSNSSMALQELTIQEGRLTWLVYMIGAAIGGRVFLNSTDEHDAMDGELACRVFQLMNLTDSRLSQGRYCEKLELAILSFFEQFRKIYIGDQVQKTSKVYRRLSDVLGLAEEARVLSVFVRKIITNLKYWSHSEMIISKTLQILNDLSVGYSSVRKLVKLEEIQFILNNHTSQHFPFLGDAQIKDMRCRTTFYTSLGRLLMIDLGEDEEKFNHFMEPLTNALDTFCRVFSGDSSLYNPEQAKKLLIGITRDLRGLVFAFNTKTSYMMLFEWIYPAYTPVLHKAIDLWYHDPHLTTPVLKLVAELVQNRAQRLQFDVSSPNGILLFRETSKMIVNYGSRILTLVDIPKDQIYQMKLKGVSICFSMLKLALCGGYVNFGVFRLYGDSALEDALNTFIKLLLSISQSDLLNFPKLSQTYYLLMECLAQDHMNFLANLEPQAFLYILSSISEGLNSLDTVVCAGCCIILDQMVTYLFKWMSRKINTDTCESETIVKVFEMHPEILQQMLSTILNIIVFEDCRSQWSMSRPLLGLILLNEEYFNQLRSSIIASQPPDKQGLMAKWFDALMEGIERNLLTKNRDRFTQNLSVFRRDIYDSSKTQTLYNSITSASNIGPVMDWP